MFLKGFKGKLLTPEVSPEPPKNILRRGALKLFLFFKEEAIKMSDKDVSKKCKKCTLDCTVLRARTLSKIPDDKRVESVTRMFVNPKPVYSRENCPKGDGKSRVLSTKNKRLS